MKKHNPMIDLWNQHYSSDQENLYKNIFVRKLFNLGHTYIASKGKHITGNILDVGSGMGYHIKFESLSPNRKYICLDKKITMLDRIHVPHVQKLVGTCGKIPLKKNSVDLIIASHILEHLQKLHSDLVELKRVLKKNGMLIVVLPCDPGFLWKLLTYITPSRWRVKKLGIDYDVVMRHEHVNTFTGCMSELENEFTISDTRYYPFGIHNYHLNILCCLTLLPKQQS
jgi:phosphatidylethanolamine/phosphatidyl-N-methylethanolamine N-methyltransferase